jgi:hypothetical protein
MIMGFVWAVGGFLIGYTGRAVITVRDDKI